MPLPLTQMTYTSEYVLFWAKYISKANTEILQ